MKTLKYKSNENLSIVLRLINDEEINGSINGYNNFDNVIIVKESETNIIKNIPVDKIVWFSFPTKDEFYTDNRDGRKYRIVKIGEQVWMADNLAFEIDKGSCAYDDDENNLEKHGRLYNEGALEDVCPEGWHVPTFTDWIKLESFLGIEHINENRQIIPWEILTDSKIIDSGFNALPSGCFVGKYKGIDRKGYYWKIIPGMKELLEVAKRLPDDKTKDIKKFYSIRCIKD